MPPPPFPFAATAIWAVPFPTAVTERRAPVELRVEREIPRSGGGTDRVSLGTRIEPPSEGALSAATLARELIELRSTLEDAIRSAGLAVAPRPDRPLSELLDTYRPRQPELVELLRDEGELSEIEYGLLREHLRSGSAVGSGSSPSAPGARTPRPVPPQPLAAAPLETERPATAPRPVDRLLEEYRIESLKQAGAVRARRQISYEEYMALKRHFSRTPAEPNAPGSPAS